MRVEQKPEERPAYRAEELMPGSDEPEEQNYRTPDPAEVPFEIPRD